MTLDGKSKDKLDRKFKAIKDCKNCKVDETKYDEYTDWPKEYINLKKYLCDYHKNWGDILLKYWNKHQKENLKLK